jgi:2-polyprenyl-6-methoxyphenol hydroxylase-like FAD-dependent oxidoreductase
MNFDYDVLIVGGAFSGAATALTLKRKCPEARVLVIEKTTAFDRKVGESTTEVSSCYMTRILGLTHYLGHHQLPKQGLRLWFSNRPDQAFDDCVEIGTRYQSRCPVFKLIARNSIRTYSSSRAGPVAIYGVLQKLQALN